MDPEGPTSATGAKGPTGPNGAMGATDAKGPICPNGAKGPTGAKVPTDPIGPTDSMGPIKVIIEKSRGGRFLWIRNSDLGWIWAEILHCSNNYRDFPV